MQTDSMYHNKGIVDKPYQSTLEGVRFSYRRRDGNTTRLIDNAIQILFDDKICVVEDHYEHGKHRNANMHLLDGIVRRLGFEHNISVSLGNLRVDLNKFELELVDPLYTKYMAEIERQLHEAIRQTARIPSLIKRSQLTYSEWLRESSTYK